MQPIHFFAFSIAFLTCGACSSGNDGENADGGRGLVAPPAQASLFFVVGPPAVAGPGCSISGSYVANIGGPPRSSMGDPGTREVDGRADAHVSCRVSGSTAFEVTGSAEKGPTSFAVPEGNVSEGSGTATISVAGPGTAGQPLMSASGGCTLDVAIEPYQIANGRIWAEFDCPVVTNPSDPGSRCSVRGEFIFENCEQ